MEYNRRNLANSTLYLVLMAMMAALTTVGTVIIAIPIPATSGILNFGDVFVMISGFLLGPVGGFIAGGFGSAMGDVVLGFYHFAPITFVVKGLEGSAVGYFALRSKSLSKITRWDILGLLVGSLLMLSGYFIAEVVLYGLAAAVAELIFANILQVTVGSTVAVIVGPTVRGFLNQRIGDSELLILEDDTTDV